jgi:hypothetical protein
MKQSMQGQEREEIRRCGVLLARSAALTVAGAFLAHLQFESLWIKVPLYAACAFLLIYAFSALALAGLGLRNVIGRSLRLEGRPLLTTGIGVLLLLAGVALGALLFFSIGALVA